MSVVRSRTGSDSCLEVDGTRYAPNVVWILPCTAWAHLGTSANHTTDVPKLHGRLTMRNSTTNTRLGSSIPSATHLAMFAMLSSKEFTA